MKTQSKTTRLALLGLLTAVLLLMAYTPLGYLNIGPLAVTFNVIPVALAAITLGPKGGLVMGTVFGLTSFGQCIGIGGTSAMGATLFSINPILTVIQCFVPRMLDGFLIGCVYKLTSKKIGEKVAFMITGFCSAAFNTVFYMTSLIVLFGNTEYLQGLIAGRNIILFVCSFVGINAVCEMISSTIITGAIGVALHKARVLPAVEQV